MSSKVAPRTPAVVILVENHEEKKSPPVSCKFFLLFFCVSVFDKKLGRFLLAPTGIIMVLSLIVRMAEAWLV